MLGDYFVVCNCRCHDSPSTVKHIMACCFTCDTCDKRIKNVHYRTHTKECAEAQEELMKKYLKEYEDSKK